MFVFVLYSYICNNEMENVLIFLVYPMRHKLYRDKYSGMTLIVFVT